MTVNYLINFRLHAQYLLHSKQKKECKEHLFTMILSNQNSLEKYLISSKPLNQLILFGKTDNVTKTGGISEHLLLALLFSSCLVSLLLLFTNLLSLLTRPNSCSHQSTVKKMLNHGLNSKPIPKSQTGGKLQPSMNTPLTTQKL